MTMIDSTFATPINQKPLDFGVDFVVHSATKYLSGHNDILAGVLVGADQGRMRVIRDGRGILGGMIDANSAYLLSRGLKHSAFGFNSKITLPSRSQSFWKNI
jgi:cystathionine gamma-synthase